MKKKHNEKTPAEAMPEDTPTGWENAVEADPAAVEGSKTETPDLSLSKQQRRASFKVYLMRSISCKRVQNKIILFRRLQLIQIRGASQYTTIVLPAGPAIGA